MMLHMRNQQLCWCCRGQFGRTCALASKIVCCRLLLLRTPAAASLQCQHCWCCRGGGGGEPGRHDQEAGGGVARRQ